MALECKFGPGATKVFISFFLSSFLLLGCKGSPEKTESSEKAASQGTPVAPIANQKKTPEENDPYQLYSYTLPNGLKIFVSPNKIEPALRAEIVVKAGSGEDPSDATGLAHYLEHLLFKGNQKLGTKDFAQEKPYMDQIEKGYLDLFHEKDPEKRKRIQRGIDEASVKSAQYVVFNEFDSLYRNLGQSDLNAFTSTDRTVYLIKIPKNRFHQWAQVESERFVNPVFRLFQWELEVVFEEKNRSLDNPMWRIWESVMLGTYPHHPYGEQTTIGTIEHLKNPPLHKVHEYFKTHYVPNNMAIVISGDVDPEDVYQTIKARFSFWKAQPIPKPIAKAKPLRSSPVENLFGKGESRFALGFSVDTRESYSYPQLKLVQEFLKKNLGELVIQGKLKSLDLDLDLNRAGAAFFLFAQPMPGQNLEQARDAVLSEIRRYASGDVQENMVKGARLAVKNASKLALEDNESRAAVIRDHFVLEQPWEMYAQFPQHVSKVTQKDLVAAIKKYFTGHYATVFYKNGPYTAPIIEKPQITPLGGLSNKEGEHSNFYKEVLAGLKNEKPIEPKFLNLKMDVSTIQISPAVQLIASRNPYNDLAQVSVEYRKNSLEDPMACFWMNVLPRTDTQTMSQVDFSRMLYARGVTLNYYCSRDEFGVTLLGPEAELRVSLADVIGFMENPKLDAKVITKEAQKIVESRKETYTDPNSISRATRSYLAEGPYSSLLLQPKGEELLRVKPEDYASFIKAFQGAEQVLLYVGNRDVKDVAIDLKSVLPLSEAGKQPIRKIPHLRSLQSSTSKVLFLNVKDMSQAHLLFVRSPLQFRPNQMGRSFDLSTYIEFLSGDMSSPFFREIREKRALAYAAYAGLQQALRKDDQVNIIGFVGTQSDKLTEAFNVAELLLNKWPSITNEEYQATVSAIKARIESEPVPFRGVPRKVKLTLDLGLSSDPRKLLYERIQKGEPKGINAVAEQLVKNKPFVFAIVGDKNRLDLSAFKKNFEFQEIDLKDVVTF